MKVTEKQSVELRKPRQERSRQKVELILEATIRLLEKSGIDALTTNAIAVTAGVSIGTLYQFFSNKEAILDALADVETQTMATRVTAVMQDAAIVSQEKRIAAIVRAVATTYGNRRQAHRQVMAHSLAKRSARLAPLLSGLQRYLSEQRTSGAYTAPIQPADAFVLTHAFAGVLRAMTSQGDGAPPQAEIEVALTRLVSRFLG